MQTYRTKAILLTMKNLGMIFLAAFAASCARNGEETTARVTTKNSKSTPAFRPSKNGAYDLLMAWNQKLQKLEKDKEE